MKTFHDFAVAVNARYRELAQGTLFVAGSGADDIFAHYLAAYPEGSNPIYKVRTEHDCSCCKAFVRNIGRLVSVSEGQVQTIWPTEGLEEPFATVSKAMHDYVLSLPIRTLYRTKEMKYGAEYSRQLLEEGKVKRWEHFWGEIAAPHRSERPGEEVGMFEANLAVFKRGLVELSPEALEQVVELIESKALYRGEEHLQAVKAFAALHSAYRRLHLARVKELFVLMNASDPATRFRNTVIGTLVQDLSDGVALETAVASFESKVAPLNYKRTSALITPRMVQDALKTVKELGLESALERRLARMSDLSVNNVLWVDRGVRGQMKGGIEEVLMKAASAQMLAPAKGELISVDDFIARVLPVAQGMQFYLRTRQASNFVTLTAPVHADAGRLFRWGNQFAWSYDGNITDSIKERVKAAGGNVDAKLRFSLAWSNYDDLDIHVITPHNEHIYFGNKCGILDVDMNAMRATSRTPVENMSFRAPHNGRYQVRVNQYCQRERQDFGFTVEVACGTLLLHCSHRNLIPQGQTVDVGHFFVKNGLVDSYIIGEHMSTESIPIEKWGLKSERMHKVQSVLLSPNHWDGECSGNRHLFFILEGCKTAIPARGIYNEFLNGALEKHRKVFEVLGEKTKCEPTDEQLSGVGFSSTRGDTVSVAVQRDGRNDYYNVLF